MTDKGEVYVFGCGDSGRLGFGDKEDVNVPTLLECPDYSGWKSFYIGHSHCIGMTNNRSSYVWGKNKYGQLGIGRKENQYLPVLLESPLGKKWKTFACGFDFSIGLTEDGSCYSW